MTPWERLGFEAVIGLEVHCQLSTESKLFCDSPAKPPEGVSVADVGVNENTCEVCTGHPGTLPVLNQQAVDYAIRAGLGTNCTVNLTSTFARKHYFYPDLPKGYQITQFDVPICENGYLDLENKRVRIQRIHIEEDAGKNVHMESFSLVNLNRAGVPLIEIVSGPDMRSPDEAGEYLRKLHAIVTYLGICDGNMQEGNFRCDANVSVRPIGSEKFGTRTELKNINSFRYVEKAIEFEIMRQIDVLQSGGRVIQETRLYDPNKNQTFPMRSKEQAHDYRYFPEPDLPPLILDPTRVERIRATLPELPDQKKLRYMQQYALSAYDASVITASQSLAQMFEGVLKEMETRNLTVKDSEKLVANLLTGEISRLVNETQKEVSKSKLQPSHLVDLVVMLKADELSITAAKTVIAELWDKGGSVLETVDQLGLKQVNDLSVLEPIVDQVIASNPEQVADYRAGKEKLFGFFVGQAMKISGGKANPKALQDCLRKKLNQS
jgi:aspartyl-tRNA(Asn)/glutamyl-tRNA(Gln) amidotransferase subunit B